MHRSTRSPWVPVAAVEGSWLVAACVGTLAAMVAVGRLGHGGVEAVVAGAGVVVAAGMLAVAGMLAGSDSTLGAEWMASRVWFA